MRKPLKRAALGIGRSAGIFHLYGQSKWRRNRLAILCYHGVSLDDEHEWDPALYITADLLEDRLRLLQRGKYNVLPLDEAVTRLQAGTLPPRSVALTFDDGPYDFYARALPLLQKYKLPATVYLTTFYCTHPRPVFRLWCSYLLWKSRATFRGGPLLGMSTKFETSSPAGRAHALAAIEQHSANLSLHERDHLAEQLAADLNLDHQALLSRRILQLMNPDEVAQLQASSIAVELHTHRHRTPRDRHLFLREITDNRREIQAMTGREPFHFCYPSGVYFPEFLPWLRDLGVISATTCDSGLASRRTDPLLLPRITDHSGLSAAELESWLLGVSSRSIPRD